MVSKKIFLEVEHAVSLGAEGLDINRLLLPLPTNEAQELYFMPRKLFSDVNSFIKRNSLAVLGVSLVNKQEIHKCCERCLKAYLLERIKERGLSKQLSKILEKILPCETGHHGYYLDEDKLKKI